MKFEPWEGDDATWDALCGERDEIHQSTASTRAYEAFGGVTHRIRALGADGRPLAAVAVVEVGSKRAPAADRVFARRFHVQGGPLLFERSAEAAAAAVACVQDLARQRGAVETDWKPLWPGETPALPFSAEGWTPERFGIAWRTLPESKDEVAGTFAGVHRSAARQAEREGMVVRPARDLDEAAALFDASMTRSGLTPRNRAFLVKLHEGLVAAGAARLLVCDDAQGPAAAVFGARCGRAVFVLFAGRAERPTRGAANLLHLSLFEDAVAEGVRRAHDSDAGLEDGTGPAVPEGITRFKRLMGFRVDPAERGRLVHRRVARRVHGAALTVYRHLRGGT